MGAALLVCLRDGSACAPLWMLPQSLFMMVADVPYLPTPRVGRHVRIMSLETEHVHVKIECKRT